MKTDKPKKQIKLPAMLIACMRATKNGEAKLLASVKQQATKTAK